MEAETDLGFRVCRIREEGLRFQVWGYQGASTLNLADKRSPSHMPDLHHILEVLKSTSSGRELSRMRFVDVVLVLVGVVGNIKPVCIRSRRRSSNRQ